MSPRASTDESPAFEERQHFRQPWLVGVLVLVVGAIVWGWWAGRGDDSEDGTVALVLALGSTAATAVWFGIMHLRTVVDDDGLDVRFVRGAGAHHFAPSEMASVASVTYHPLREFGGWGTRWGRGGDRAYNVSGNRGVEVIDRSGRRWVIGSRRPDELAAAIAALGVPRGRRDA